MQKKVVIGLIAAIIFLIGAGYIVYMGRPVMKLNPETPPIVTPTSTESEPTTPPTTTVGNPTTPPTTSPTTPPTTPPAGIYTLAQVSLHSTKTDCWSTINGSVYDLTTWVSRHPGGSGVILKLCGTDGSAAFNTQHGTAKKPAAMLLLLKIGTLK
jgi:hypothetical protein